MNTKIVIVNNPAAKTSGALTILNEFLKKISSLKCQNKFYIFVTLKELEKYQTEKVKIIVLPNQGIIERIRWDNYKLKKYLKENKIEPDIFISLQNTGVNLPKKILQIIYYHQLLPLIDFKWSLLKKTERQFWIYKHIYPFFISQYLGRSYRVIIQTNWVKKLFNERFKYPLENMIVIKPVIKLPDNNKIKKIKNKKFRIFYPATPLIYKNHKIILEALKLLKDEKKSFIDEIECVFTFSKGENFELDKIIEEYNLKENMKLIGEIPYEKVLEYYRNSNLLVFPSKIETLGLPLLEASYLNLDILAADLAYSREALENYKKVDFLDSNNSKNWANKIKEKYLESKKNIRS